MGPVGQAHHRHAREGDGRRLPLFPEPDLAPYDLTDEFVERVRAKLPELPDARAARFAQTFGLAAYDARHLVEHRSTADFFEACMEAPAKTRRACETGGEPGHQRRDGVADAQKGASLQASPLTPARAVALVRLVSAGELSSKQGKEVFAAVLEEDRDPAAIVEERG